MIRFILSVIAVAVAWFVMDYVIHGILLMPSYQETASLWRPDEEMKCGLMMLVTVISAFLFTGIYQGLVRPKSLITGLKYGVFFGLAAGIPMGLGTYSVMPIPFSMAATWLVGALLESIVAGLIVGALVTGCCCEKKEAVCEAPPTNE